MNAIPHRIATLILIPLFALALSVPARAVVWGERGPSESVADENKTDFIELFRVRIADQASGPISVSSDAGSTWSDIGHVIVPSTPSPTKATPQAAGRPAAASPPPPSTPSTSRPARTEPTASSSASSPSSSSKNPRTTIPSTKKRRARHRHSRGHGVLRRQVVALRRQPRPGLARRQIFRHPRWLRPTLGDSIQIVVERPRRYPSSLEFENRFGGFIRLRYPDGEEKVVGMVLKPVQGCGRFTGTQFSDVGRLRANHTGVIDISTTPIGTIGGFQIIPRTTA